jgi:hypothetical protein
MPENIASYILITLFAGLWLLASIRFLSKYIKSKYGPIKTVDAVIVDKHTIEHFSKYKGNGTRVEYIVVFSINGKKKGFTVSEFSYSGYRRNESGKLTYRGDRIISFK